MKTNSNIHSLIVPMIVSAALLSGGLSARAANGTWSATPADSSWTNAANWQGSVPGIVNNTSNNGVDGSSIALFTNAITTYGGAANPIVPDDATVANGKARMMYRLNFDGPDCGAYVFYSPSPFAAQTASTPETGVLSLCDSTGSADNNGSYIGAAVTNPQTFLVPVQIRLPSSTTGQYGFTNNAVSPNATYYFSDLFEYSQATGRGVTFVFAGSNTGTNTVALLSQSANQTGSPSGIRKEGTGRWILTGTNIFNSGSAMNVNGGTLEIQNPGAFGAATSVNVNNTGVLLLDNVSPASTANGTPATFVLSSGGTVQVNGNVTNNIQLSTAVGMTGTIATTSSGDMLTVAANSGGASDSILHITGPGTVVLGTSTYAGEEDLDAGTAQVTDPTSLSGVGVNIAAGATLDVSPLGATTYTLSAALGASGSGTDSTAATLKADAGGTIDLATGANPINLTFTPTSASGDTTHPALYVSQGTLSLGGNAFTIDNESGAPLGVGTYTLIQQASGSVTSAGGYAVNVTGSGLAAGTAGSIQVSGGSVNLVVITYTAQNLIWQGGNNGNTWDAGSTANWLDGGLSSVFHNSDDVTFNATGATNSSVNLSGTLAPGSVTVDTSGGDYTFTGSGTIVGPVSLTKTGSGTLTIQNANTYSGGTMVNGGTIQLGSDNAAGVGDLTLASGGALDLNTFSDLVGGLNGSGTVDSVAGGSPVLTIGNNDADGTFSGTIQNTTGTVALTKTGNGLDTLSGSNSYAGPTIINAGTLRAANANALGSNSTVTVNAGILDLASDVAVGSISGNGLIANNSSAAPVTLTVQSAAATTFNGNIIDGSGGGALAVKILNGASLTFAGTANTFSGGTIVGSGSTFDIPNSPASVGGFIIASNNATLSLSGGSGTPGTPDQVTTVDGATVTITGGAEGKIWQCQWIGGPTATNRFTTTESVGQSMSFSNFLGVVQLAAPAQANFRFFNGGGDSGGDNTTFEFDGANVHSRDAQNIHLGSIAGGSLQSGIGAQGTVVDTYYIGAKGVDMNFGGYISGSNNIVKVGDDTLTLNGGFSTNITTTDGFTFTTNLTAINLISYIGDTTISNGVLQVNVPNMLTNSQNITLASITATLDASSMGWVSNDTDNLTYTNQILITNSTLEVISGETLNGIGTIRGNVLADAGSTVNAGLPTGTLAVTGGIDLAGAVNLNVNAIGSPNSGEISAASIAVESTATLTITNLGPEVGATFQLFNHPVNFTQPVNLPALTGTNSWVNNLAVDGSITLLAPSVNTTPTNIVASFNESSSTNGSSLTLSWPADHIGWSLQVQTNSLSAGLGTNWVDVPGAELTNQITMPINPTNGAVFFRMTY